MNSVKVVELKGSFFHIDNSLEVLKRQTRALQVELSKSSHTCTVGPAGVGQQSSAAFTRKLVTWRSAFQPVMRKSNKNAEKDKIQHNGVEGVLILRWVKELGLHNPILSSL